MSCCPRPSLTPDVLADPGAMHCLAVIRTARSSMPFEMLNSTSLPYPAGPCNPGVSRSPDSQEAPGCSGSSPGFPGLHGA